MESASTAGTTETESLHPSAGHETQSNSGSTLPHLGRLAAAIVLPILGALALGIVFPFSLVVCYVDNSVGWWNRWWPVRATFLCFAMEAIIWALVGFIFHLTGIGPRAERKIVGLMVLCWSACAVAIVLCIWVTLLEVQGSLGFWVIAWTIGMVLLAIWIWNALS